MELVKVRITGFIETENGTEDRFNPFSKFKVEPVTVIGYIHQDGITEKNVYVHEDSSVYLALVVNVYPAIGFPGKTYEFIGGGSENYTVSFETLEEVGPIHTNNGYEWF